MQMNVTNLRFVSLIEREIIYLSIKKVSGQFVINFLLFFFLWTNFNRDLPSMCDGIFTWAISKIVGARSIFKAISGTLSAIMREKKIVNKKIIQKTGEKIVSQLEGNKKLACDFRKRIIGDSRQPAKYTRTWLHSNETYKFSSNFFSVLRRI